jgi:hypothetical protein
MRAGPFWTNFSAAIISIFVTAVLLADEPSESFSKRGNYARSFELATRAAYIALPPGAVEPEGWLRDWCLTAKGGYTGHMDDVDPEFIRAWAADHQMTGQRLTWPNGAWPYEGGGYWFDGLAGLGDVLHDEELKQQAKRRLYVVVDHQNAKSIEFLWWLDRNNANDVKSVGIDGGWPMWACGLLGRAMAGYYAGSKDPRVLKTLETAYSGNHDFIRMGWGMAAVWPALQTYTWTGNKEIAGALTTLFKEGGIEPGGSSWDRYSRKPSSVLGSEQPDHVVHFLETTTPWALGYLWTGNRDYLDTSLAWHDYLAREAMQPSGVPVADESFGPTGADRGTETCDVAGYLWSQVLLFSISGEARLADRAEKAFFNAGPATVGRDFKTHVYFQCPNRVRDKWPPDVGDGHVVGTSYQSKHAPLCCTAALNRILPTYVKNMWMATDDGGLAATLYGPCKVSALAGDHVPVELTCRTQYPFNETIEIDVRPAHEAKFPLSFRIPGWCAAAKVSINGEAVKEAADAQRFMRIERWWKVGDAVRLDFPMEARVTTGRDRNAGGAPYAFVCCGPLLFALPIADTKDANTPDPAARWKFALNVGKNDGKTAIEVERQAMPERWNWPLAAPLELRADAVACDWNPERKRPLPTKLVAKDRKVERITLIPYGCTKFRISMFPVTEHTVASWPIDKVDQ